MAYFRKRSGRWWYTIRLADGTKVERKGTPDKRVTAQMAAQAELEVAQIKAGTLDPKILKLKVESAKSILIHIGDWVAVTSSRGCTKAHADLSLNRVKAICAVIAGLSWKEACPPRGCTQAGRRAIYDRVESKLEDFVFSNLDATRIQLALASFVDSGGSFQSANHYRAALRAFCLWCVQDRRAIDNPMLGVRGYNAEEDPRHQRRSLSVEEAAKLVTVAALGKTVILVSGEDRSIAYRIALGTGFRAEEIKSLKTDSFNLDSSPPTITLTAAAAKNGKRVDQPINPALAEILSAWLQKFEPGSFVLPMNDHTAEMMRADLSVAEIAYETKDGFADFHALRSTYITRLFELGHDPSSVQKLARHSSPVLTLAKYAKTNQAKKAAATINLPEPPPIQPPQ